MSLDGLIDLRAQCFCDGNGSAHCWECGGQGVLMVCGDDDHEHGDECFETCDGCDGAGVVRCPAHGDERQST